MKYSKDRKLVRELLKAADIDNTIRGGMSQPEIHFSKESDHYLITAWIPGVDLKRLHVEIVEKSVILYHSMEFVQDEVSINVPHVVATFQIMAEVDYENIQAHEEDGILNIVMPFNELAGGYNREVKIEK